MWNAISFGKIMNNSLEIHNRAELFLFFMITMPYWNYSFMKFPLNQKLFLNIRCIKFKKHFLYWCEITHKKLIALSLTGIDDENMETLSTQKWGKCIVLTIFDLYFVFNQNYENNKILFLLMKHKISQYGVGGRWCLAIADKFDETFHFKSNTFLELITFQTNFLLTSIQTSPNSPYILIT